MMEISCDACEKKYRIDETKMKRRRAKVKCKACGYIMVITKPESESPSDPSLATDVFEPSPPSDDTRPSIPPTPAVPASSVDQPPGPEREEAAAEERDMSPFVSTQKIRFGLFGKIILVMLMVSLLPFGIFWFITFQETSNRIRIDTETLMAQTAKGLNDQVNDWIESNAAVLRTAARLPEVLSMDRESQEPILKAIQKEYPWMYLVFTVGADGMNVARSDDVPLKDYSDRQYYKDVMAGRGLAWQTLIGKTSKKPALVLAVPIKAGQQVIGVMAAAMTVDELSRNIATWKTGKTGNAFLVDENGFVISHPNQQFVVTRKNMNDHPLIANFRKKGWTTITTQFTNAAGRQMLGHVRSNNYGWVLAMQQDVQEVYQGLNRVQKFALALLGCTILLVSVIAWFSARAITTPIMKLTDAAERMSLGELNVQIDIKSKDEIGLLAQAIGRMQTSLRLAMNRLRRKR